MYTVSVNTKVEDYFRTTRTWVRVESANNIHWSIELKIAPVLQTVISNQSFTRIKDLSEWRRRLTWLTIQLLMISRSMRRTSSSTAASCTASFTWGLQEKPEVFGPEPNFGGRNATGQRNPPFFSMAIVWDNKMETERKKSQSSMFNNWTTGDMDESCLKVPKRETFDRSDFPDFYTIKSLRVGGFGVKIKKILQNI